MYCKNCGAEISEGLELCTECEASANIAKDPINQAYIPPVQQAKKVKKKKHIGRWISLVILLIIVFGGLWVYGSFTGSIFGVIKIGPKDLGVRYTAADYKSAMSKLGINVVFEGKSGKELDDYKKTLGDKKLNINDYTWKFTNYQKKSFQLTPAEATAMLNEIAPGFFWFDNVQVNVLPDGTMEGSSTADIAKLKTELFSDVASDIPIPLPGSLNIYSKGKINIKDNKLTSNPAEAELGMVALPDKYMTPSSVQTASSYLERIYTVVPGLIIDDLSAKSGGINFAGTIPQTVTITKK